MKIESILNWVNIQYMDMVRSDDIDSVNTQLYENGNDKLHEVTKKA